MAKESTMGRRVHQKKKNSRVSPCFYIIKILKTAFMGDVRQWPSRHRHRRHRYRRRYRRSGSKVERMMKDVKGNC
jgi:hypothetical protein